MGKISKMYLNFSSTGWSENFCNLLLYSLISVFSISNVYSQFSGGDADGFAVASLGSNGSEMPLPIELILFKGNYIDETVILKWTTATETNNDYFTICKSSDGINWESLGKVKGAGNSSIQHEYSYVDKYPFLQNKAVDLVYYRLQQTDYDGKFTFSNIINFNIEEQRSPGFHLFPNPSSHEAGIYLEFSENMCGNKKTIVIYDACGKECFFTFVGADDFRRLINVNNDLEKILPGVYFVTLFTNNSLLNQKLVVH